MLVCLTEGAASASSGMAARRRGATPPPSRAQGALDAFVTSQLLDNGMDSVAARVNGLRERLLRLQTTSGGAEDKRRLARRLQHSLATACRLLTRQRTQIQDALEAVEIDLRDGVIGESSSRDRGETATNEYRRTYARPAAGSVAAGDQSVDVAASYVAPQPEDVLPRACLVAAKVARSHELWILARVVRFDAASSTYEVEDVDSGEEDDDGSAPRRHHLVPWNQVVELPAGSLKAGEWIQYAVDERVMAMYPNTTSFYRSTVRVPNPKGAPFVVLKFDEDEDEDGFVPDQKVPFRFVAPLKPWHIK